MRWPWRRKVSRPGVAPTPEPEVWHDEVVWGPFNTFSRPGKPVNDVWEARRLYFPMFEGHGLDHQRWMMEVGLGVAQHLLYEALSKDAPAREVA